MKYCITAGIWLFAICLGGCAGSLPPHEALNQAVTKSFAATGFNYSSTTRITDLTLPTDIGNKEPDRKSRLPLGAGLEVVRGISINTDGAVDMTARKSQVLYDLRYDRDNVEVSIKLPMLMDYGTQMLYVGTSLFTTILETLYPQAPAIRGKLVRIDLNELMREGTADNPDLAKLLGDNRFTARNIDLINGAFKDAVQKGLARVNDGSFSDQPLSEQDRKAGVVRRIRVQLGHGDSVDLALDAVQSVARTLHQEGVITRQEHDVLLTLTDRQLLGEIVEKFSLALVFQVGIAPSGHVAYVEGLLNVSDREGLYRLGIANLSTFANYDAPRFSLTPETGGVVDFKEVMEAIAAASADDEDEENPEEGGSAQGNS